MNRFLAYSATALALAGVTLGTSGAAFAAPVSFLSPTPVSANAPDYEFAVQNDTHFFLHYIGCYGDCGGQFPAPDAVVRPHARQGGIQPDIAMNRQLVGVVTYEVYEYTPTGQERIGDLQAALQRTLSYNGGARFDFNARCPATNTNIPERIKIATDNSNPLRPTITITPAKQIQ
jgi:hypothetical protein